MMTENSTPTAETGGPEVGLSAEERNGRGQMLDEKSKKQTRDGLGIPGLLAEPTGTDGRRIIRKTTCVTGRHYGPVLDIRVLVCFLIGIACSINGRREHMALER